MLYCDEYILSCMPVFITRFYWRWRPSVFESSYCNQDKIQRTQFKFEYNYIILVSYTPSPPSTSNKQRFSSASVCVCVCGSIIEQLNFLSFLVSHMVFFKKEKSNQFFMYKYSFTNKISFHLNFIKPWENNILRFKSTAPSR